jgi:hypothetical protein
MPRTDRLQCLPGGMGQRPQPRYSTVTLFARFGGRSAPHPRRTVMEYAYDN